MASSSEAQIKSEIERLTATINQHKAHQKAKTWNTGNNYYAPYPQGGPPGRSNAYVNPNYKPANKYIRPGLNLAGPSKPTSTPSTTPVTTPGTSAIPTPVAPSVQSLPGGGRTKEVVLGGVAFESSRRSLVRKDLPKPVSTNKPNPSTLPQHLLHYRKPGHRPPSKSYKPKHRGRNMTLNNTRRQYRSPRKLAKLDKPCPRFTTTGALRLLYLLLKARTTPKDRLSRSWGAGSCSRGLTCMYQHDPAKIAICWNFLQDNCTKTAETCELSHEPTPQRTPLCVHFLNKGRCTRDKCPFPHVNVGQRVGVCRDFAVLGYCERGLDCDRQHVRECPDFAEKGACGTRGCKLPHVIRANRNRKVAIPAVPTAESGGMEAPKVTAEDGKLGDEYISLTFMESESEEESGEEEEEEEDGEEEDDEEEDESEAEMADLEVNM